jgi:hypothetical protein
VPNEYRIGFENTSTIMTRFNNPEAGTNYFNNYACVETGKSPQVVELFYYAACKPGIDGCGWGRSAVICGNQYFIYEMSSSRGPILFGPFLVKPQTCTKEAKICPDGSAVGRTGSDCEFAPCPNGTGIPLDTKGKSPENCKTLWWFDTDHRECSQRQFCGAYMYAGLNTFETEGLCEVSLSQINESCANAGESLKGNQSCCIGLTLETIWGGYERIYVGDQCYVTGNFFELWIPVSYCINCGDDTCEYRENPCNCAQDCTAKNMAEFNFRDGYADAEDFCNRGYETYCGTTELDVSPDEKAITEVCDRCKTI